jgi:predicted nucleic acid-binding protein
VKGQKEAKQLLEQIQELPVTILRSIDNATLETAGRLKVNENISLADSFALAAAKLLDAHILSSDHHEFDPIAAKGEFVFEWIR